MDIQVRHNPEGQRFETKFNGQSAYLSYSVQGGSISFDHTFVPEDFRGRGVASALVRTGLEEARRQQWKVVPRCAYVAAFIERHPEFADLVN